MADNNKVKLKIETEADTKGADTIEARLKALKQRADDLADSQKDIGEATGDTSPQLEVDPEIKDQMSKMLRIQYAGIARDIGQGITSMARALEDTAKASALADPELSKTLHNTAIGLDSLSLGLSSAAQGFAVAGPLGGAIGGMVGLMAGPLKSAFNDYQESLVLAGQAEAAAAESTKRLQTARESFALQVKDERLAEYFRTELNLIEDTIKAIERKSKIAESERSLANAGREAQQAKNARDPNQSFAQRETADVSGDLASAEAEITAAIAKSAQLANSLSDVASKLEAKADQMASEFSGATQEEADAARKAAEEARQAATNAQLDVDAAAQSGANKIQELITGFGTRLDDATETVQKTAADEAEDILDKVISSGAELTETQKLAKQNLEKILADGQVSAAEQTGLQQALTTLILGWKTDISQVQSVLAEANKISGSLASGLTSIRDEQNRIRQQVNQLSSR